MSPFLEVPDQQHSSHISTHKDLNHICILKSKENIFIPKFNRVLKKKLKKYKLRRDGKEDPDIIDMSKILVSTLKIKSPNGQEVHINNCNIDSEDRLPKNYLFKMVRKKNECLKLTSRNQNEVKSNDQNEGESMIALLPETETNKCQQTDAFKLLMDSRNKSIGSNSPGKEKVIDNNDEIEKIKKRELKSKRNLFLQQMSQKKGYMKNQENEDYIDECIKRKLEKRANKLREMITSNTSRKDRKLKTLQNNIADNSHKTNSVLKKEGKKSILKSGELQLFNFLSSDGQSSNEIQDNSKISPEDDEFLKKLSPSIKKKENMLSYFKKVTNDVDDEPLSVNNDDGNSIIKVKFAPKHKKKKKNIDSCKLDLIDVPRDLNITLSNSSTSARKRKRDKIVPIHCIENDEKHQLDETNNERGRPKRTVTKPIKYSDDILLSTSDEELYIFTPKKKKSLDKSIDVKRKQKSKHKLNSIEAKDVSKDNSSSGIKNDSEKGNDRKSKVPKKGIKSKEKCINVESNKAVKLAPIFSAKSKLTPLEQEARQKFLKSGIPDKLKIKQKDSNNIVLWNNFYTTRHIQQNLYIDTEVLTPSDASLEHKIVDWIAIVGTDTKKNVEYDEAHLFEKLLIPCDEKIYKLPLKHKPELLLKCLKKRYSKFPVYRTFHLLKAKNNTETIKGCSLSELDNSVEIVNDFSDIPDCPDKLTWYDKYKPISSKEIIGNFESVKELKRWLESWSENLIKKKSSIIGGSDLSDFCFSDSDLDSGDAFQNKNNVLIISGQTGTGKTSSVYAVAAELSIKVIEVNASSKRTGKIMLQNLQEATQSHKVNRGNNKKEGSQSSQEKYTTSKIVKKHGRPKKTYERKKCVDAVKIDVSNQQSLSSSEETNRTEMSLILIDDADIVFDQDDGFGSAVSQLINYSKRPVILTTSSLTCPHLQKYISFGKIIKMSPLIPRMLGTWLDIMCLADTSSCYPGFGCKLLDYFRGDIRKTINFLQFYMISNKHLSQIEDTYQDTDVYKTNIDDENSSMSWADQDIADNNFTIEIADDIEMKIIGEWQLSVLNTGDSPNLLDVWWNIGNELKSIGTMQSKNTPCNTDVSIDDASRILDTLSFVDCLDSNINDAYDITSKPWLSVEVPSVMDKENMDCYNIMNTINKDISKELITRSVSLVKGWEEKPKCPPSASTQRRRNKIVLQHNTLSKYLNPASSLDRRALALDYWSSCRTICRLEKDKTDSNVKRNNRFCHYLKSVNILCRNDYFDCLSESLT